MVCSFRRYGKETFLLLDLCPHKEIYLACIYSRGDTLQGTKNSKLWHPNLKHVAEV